MFPPYTTLSHDKKLNLYFFFWSLVCGSSEQAENSGNTAFQYPRKSNYITVSNDLLVIGDDIILIL